MHDEPDQGKETHAPSQESDAAWELLNRYFEPRNLAAAQARRAAEPTEDVVVRQFRTLAVALLPVIGGPAAIELLNTLWAMHDRVLYLEAKHLHERDDVGKLRDQVAELLRKVAAIREPIPHDDPSPVHRLQIAQGTEALQ